MKIGKESVKGEPRVVVSLTSFPGAIDYAPGAIRSVLEGSYKPDRVVLYVTMAQFGEAGLPPAILELEREYGNFEVRDYDTDIRSYRKLIPALRDFPDAVIVTVDDDVKYHPHMLRDFMRLHGKYPTHVLAHRAKRIYPDRPYRKWRKYRWYHFLGGKVYDRFDTMQTGAGGVLYPPGVLRGEMLDPTLFTRLAPTADDIWFWAAAVANGHKTMPVPFGHNKPESLGKPKALSLKTVNFKRGVDRNKETLDRILAAYPEIKARLYGK